MTHGEDVRGGAADDVPTLETPDQRYRKLLEHSPDAICVHQMGQVRYVNAAAVRWMRAASADQLVGSLITQFVAPDSVPAMLERIAALRHPGDVSAPSEAVMLRFDGTTLEVDAVSVLSTWNDEPAYQVIFRDLTVQKAAQAALHYQAALVDHVSDAIIATTSTGLVTSWNPAAEQIYGRGIVQVLGRPVSEAVGAHLDPREILDAGGSVTTTHYTPQGSMRAIRVSAAVMDDGFVLLCSDQTALRRAERHFEAVVATLDEAVVVLGHTGRVISTNPAVARLLGPLRKDTTDYHDLVDHWFNTRQAQMHDSGGTPTAPGHRPILRTLATGVPFEGEILTQDPQHGRRMWLAMTCRRLNPEEGDRSAVIVVFRDVTAARSTAERLAHEARHDPLTGLGNRAHLAETARRLRVDGELAAVVFVDLDDLKSVNDSLGHDAGDLVIQAAAGRIRDAVRRDDVVCRLAGDEFVVLLADPAFRAEVDDVATRIKRSLIEPIAVAGSTVRMGASIGVVTVAPDDDRDAAALLREADRAMYAAKATDRRTVVHSPFNPPVSRTTGLESSRPT